MYVSGIDAAQPEEYALTRLEALLKAKFAAAPYAAIFQPYGGILVTKDAKEGEKWLAGSKRPVLFLDPDEATAKPDNSAQWGARIDGVVTPGTRWLIEIPIECVVSAYAAPAERPLVRCLNSVILAALDEFDALAMEEAELNPGQGRSTREGRVNPHVFSCAVHAVI